MDRFWIIVAHRSGVRIFSINRLSEHLRPVLELDHPEGRLTAQEIESDRPGRTFGGGNSARPGQSGYAEPEQTLTQAFCRKIAQVVEEARTHQRFQSLLLVAEPHVLGGLRSMLSEPAKASVAGSTDLNLAQLPIRELEERLRPWIRDAFQSSVEGLSA